MSQASPPSHPVIGRLTLSTVNNQQVALHSLTVIVVLSLLVFTPIHIISYGDAGLQWLA